MSAIMGSSGKAKFGNCRAPGLKSPDDEDLKLVVVCAFHGHSGLGKY